MMHLMSRGDLQQKRLAWLPTDIDLSSQSDTVFFVGCAPYFDIAAVAQGLISDRFEAVGSLEAGDAIDVVAEIDAIVLSLPFREGAAVNAGDVLAQLDDATLRAEATRAAALRDQTRVTYERVKTVVEQNAGAPQDLDDALAALKVAEANLAVAEARLAKTRIAAPFAGVVGSRRVSPGAFLRAGQAITALSRIDEIKVIFWVPERYVPDKRPER